MSGEACAQRRDDLAAYALGALAAEEALDLEHHLHACEACRDRLRWLEPAVDLLPASVGQLSPPPRLRESLMATVRAEAPAAEPAAEPATRQRGSGWAGLRGFMLRPAVGLAVVVVLVVGIGVGYGLRGGETGEPQPELVEARALVDSGAVSATLERSGDSATLHVHHLPAIHNDEVYEVWVQRAGVMEPRSTFVLERDGSAEAAVPGPLEGGEAVYVTREPRGGSHRPTSEPVLTAPL